MDGHACPATDARVFAALHVALSTITFFMRMPSPAEPYAPSTNSQMKIVMLLDGLDHVPSTLSDEIVVLLDGLGHVPDAGHAIGERDEISSFDLCRLTARPLLCGRHQDLAFKNVGLLCAAVLPIELGHVAAPRAPAGDLVLALRVCLGHLDHLDLWEVLGHRSRLPPARD